MLGPVLLSVHNIRFYQRLMADIRKSIQGGTFAEFQRNDPRSTLGPREEKKGPEES
jgi:tRNA-guanine family transglycosylase